MYAYKLRGWYSRHHYYLTFRVKVGSAQVRDRIMDAIEKALADPPPPRDQKPSAMGFHHYGPEDEQL